MKPFTIITKNKQREDRKIINYLNKIEEDKQKKCCDRDNFADWR